MHRYLQTSRPLFLFRRPVVFGKECKSCQMTLKLPLLHMEQKCLQSKAHSQEQRFHLTAKNPSNQEFYTCTSTSQCKRNNHAFPMCILHPKEGQIERYIYKITELLTQDVRLGYQVQSSQSWHDLFCSGVRQMWRRLAFTGSCTVFFTSKLQHKLGPELTGEITVVIVSCDNR